MEIRNNENCTEDFSEEKNIPETKKGIWKVHKKTVDNFEKQINRAPYFQKHQIQVPTYYRFYNYRNLFYVCLYIY